MRRNTINRDGPVGTLAALRASSGLPQRHDGIGPGQAVDHMLADHEGRIRQLEENQLTGGESTESGTSDGTPDA
jgi:hypothetical protein